LIGGTGGGGGSIPFLSDAPGGRSTVSITEVADMNTGSDISDFAIDFLRVPDFVSVLVLWLVLNELPTGVLDPDIGGVEVAE
jgi:hypothetical protein